MSIEVTKRATEAREEIKEKLTNEED